MRIGMAGKYQRVAVGDGQHAEAALTDGVPAADMPALKTRLTADSTRAQLRVVNG